MGADRSRVVRVHVVGQVWQKVSLSIKPSHSGQLSLAIPSWVGEWVPKSLLPLLTPLLLLLNTTWLEEGCWSWLRPGWSSVAWPGSGIRVGTGGLGNGNPAGSSGGVSMGVGAKPQKPKIYKQFAAVKCFSTQNCCRVHPPSPLSLKKPYGSADANPMTQHVRPTRGYATGGHNCDNYNIGLSYEGMSYKFCARILRLRDEKSTRSAALVRVRVVTTA